MLVSGYSPLHRGNCHCIIAGFVQISTRKPVFRPNSEINSVSWPPQAALFCISVCLLAEALGGIPYACFRSTSLSPSFPIWSRQWRRTCQTASFPNNTIAQLILWNSCVSVLWRVAVPCLTCFGCCIGAWSGCHQKTVPNVTNTNNIIRKSKLQLTRIYLS